jgi:hypothetical protein
MSAGDEKESWDRAKSLILGAVEAMIQLKDGKKTDSGPGQAGGSISTGSTSVPGAGTSTASASESTSVNNPTGKSKPSVYNEHRRIFGYQPSKVYSSKRAIGKGKGKGKKKAVGTWTKEVICLKDCDQETSPSTEEKIELAQLNLGLRKLVFSAEGDANHIHDVICRSFPILEECGGYTLMRVSENSRDLVAIEGPDGGVTVTFLKDILRQAKLYVRPLQCDIPEERLKMLNKESREVKCYID